MEKSGKTPLYRAKKLEKVLGIKEIYLKLEGANPTGHKFDRIADFIVRESERTGRKGIVADGSRQYINSIVYYAEQSGVEVVVPFFDKDMQFKKKYYSNRLHRVKNVNSNNRASWIQKYCEEKDYINAFDGYSNNTICMIALERISDELISKIKDDVTTIYSQLSYGYTVTSLYNSYYRNFINGNINHIPRMISCTNNQGNVLYDNYRGIYKVDSKNNESNNQYANNLMPYSLDFFETSVRAINDTQGEIIEINNEYLHRAINVVKKEEGIHLSLSEAYPLAGLLKNIEEGKIQNGKHVVILNDAKSNHKVKYLSKNDNFSNDTLVNIVKKYLTPYSDSYNETQNAIENAREKGAVILAYLNEDIIGIAIVVNMGFRDFIPTYHLAYIGTESGKKGRGIASALLDEVIDFSDGNISLHVDLDNKQAKRLYEKIGFKHCYNRMIYKE